MKIYLLISMLLLFCLNTFSQIQFENGYFITNADKRIACLIKNIDWQFNPSEFEYKLSETSDIKTASIKEVKEFGIKNASKYVRAKVNIDKSSEDLIKLTTTRNPVFQQEVLFLKVLVEGKATLFIYEERDLRRYFYQTVDSEINQLVYKPYLINTKQVGYNDQFRQQLLNDLPCEDISIYDIKKIKFYKNELVRFFITYNACQNSEYISYEVKNRKDKVNLTIRPGINFSSLEINNTSSASESIDFGPATNYRLGVEIELFMPFNKNKWAVLIEPTYQQYKLQKDYVNQNVAVNYKSIELAFGLRHYFHLNEHSKIFINTSVIKDLSINSSINYDTGRVLELYTLNNYAVGLGYHFYKRYNLELRYLTSRKVLEKYSYWDSEYKTVSLIFGYSFY
jgi:hypothetical protein